MPACLYFFARIHSSCFFGFASILFFHSELGVPERVSRRACLHVFERIHSSCFFGFASILFFRSLLFQIFLRPSFHSHPAVSVALRPSFHSRPVVSVCFFPIFLWRCIHLFIRAPSISDRVFFLHIFTLVFRRSYIFEYPTPVPHPPSPTPYVITLQREGTTPLHTPSTSPKQRTPSLPQNAITLYQRAH